MFRTALARGWELHRPAVVVYGGDKMSAEGRRLIEREFSIPVLSRYSAVEAFRIGFTCERSTSFHLHEDLCVVRVVDGEIVVTDLTNRGMVLLNYRLGDTGQLGPAGCDCGRTSALLTELEGRSSRSCSSPTVRRSIRHCSRESSTAVRRCCATSWSSAAPTRSSSGS